MYWLGSKRAGYSLAALENAYGTLLPDAPIEITTKVRAEEVGNLPSFAIRWMPHHVQREHRTCR